MKEAVARYGLSQERRVHVVALGKAAVRMYEGAREALRAPPASAIVVVPRGGSAHEMLEARLVTGAHPVPDQSSLRAGRIVADALGAADSGDTVLVLLSGGASSICVLPAPGVTVEEYAETVRTLLHAGADIHEINTIRRHIDALKGGGMAALGAASRIVGLIVSDVPGDDIASIASGPLSRSPTGAVEAQRILDRYDIDAAIVRDAVRSTVPDDAFDRVSVDIVLNNSDALRGASARARQLGYQVVPRQEVVTGEAKETAERLISWIESVDRSAEAPTCAIAGGETTVTVRGEGRGGRNHELVLAASLLLAPSSRIVFGSVGTDGVDGSTNAAGAVADGMTTSRARAAGMNAADALARNDSGSFFESVGGSIRTGATGTNVMDVMAAVCGPLR